ncbi:MAG TPA: CHAT domain-containing protein, partial [Acidobacteriota bacterium]|nr:CHAT domain-containing protein [Acidobacteriota bacterium]
ETFDRALEMANDSKRGDLQATVLNDLGAVQAEAGEFSAAIRSFQESAGFAHETELPVLEATARINEAAVRIRDGRRDGLDTFLAENLRLTRQLRDCHEKVLCLLSTGSQYWLSGWWLGYDASWRRKAYESYLAGLASARILEDHRLVSYSLGYIGRLYEDERRYDEALSYTRQAVFIAQQADAADALYQWEWQAARVMRDRGDTEQAIAGYRRAIRAVEDIRNSLSGSMVSFQTVVGPVFREFADLLLRRSSTNQDTQAAQRDLLEVRATLEKLRQAEIADYFRDDCVVQSQGATQIDAVSTRAAIIYPVLLQDRVELLVSLPGALERFTVPVSLQELTSVIREFRQNIETSDPLNRFLPQARRLHDWLMAPLENSLGRDGIDTLVIVPDGPLRTIPLSALYDGNQFLIEKYAVATTPGLTLTMAAPVAPAKAQALASGLTESVQGFNPLPNVASELAGIQSVFATNKLQDRTFKTASVEREVARGSYSIVHFATHGHFDGDHDKSFLVTFDGKLTMDGLQETVGRRRYRQEAVELLVLSACETATGDDRAALGLAGVGLKAGARSVVASLWSISDESTAMLIAEFYRHLKEPNQSKASALRAAQRSLLKQERFRHPFFWAPFLLIGNWL